LLSLLWREYRAEEPGRVGLKALTKARETVFPSTLGIVPKGPMPLPPEEGEKTGGSTGDGGAGEGES